MKEKYLCPFQFYVAHTVSKRVVCIRLKCILVIHVVTVKIHRFVRCRFLKKINSINISPVGVVKLVLTATNNFSQLCSKLIQSQHIDCQNVIEFCTCCNSYESSHTFRGAAEGCDLDLVAVPGR